MHTVLGLATQPNTRLEAPARAPAARELPKAEGEQKPGSALLLGSRPQARLWFNQANGGGENGGEEGESCHLERAVNLSINS